jgi:hypothetical protein
MPAEKADVGIVVRTAPKLIWLDDFAMETFKFWIIVLHETVHDEFAVLVN